MRAIVTGGAGFIGSHVADALLAREDEVHVLDDLSSGDRANLASEAELHEVDIRDERLLPLVEKLRPEVVFHLAAQADVGTSVERPTVDADVNVIGTIRVLEAAREADARVVFTSTGGAIYGDVQKPATENSPRLPASPYAASKLAGEEYLAMWNRLRGTSHVVCRLANVYGPRQLSTLEGGVVAIFLERLREGLPTEIYGDGGQTRDFVYVGDAVEAILAAAEAGKPGVFNVASGTATRIVDLHRLCARAAGVEQEPSFADPRPGDVRHSVLDPTRARQELGWQAETSLEQGLRLTWDAG
jgi:UDP-glucose 4-epimerase